MTIRRFLLTIARKLVNKVFSLAGNMLIMMGGVEQQQVSSIKQSKWRTVGIRVKENDLFILNQKLELNGFKTLNEFVHA